MNIRKGMLVRILPRQDEWEHEGPSYTDGMTHYENRTFTVDYIDGRGWVNWQGYSWDSEWLLQLDVENE